MENCLFYDERSINFLEATEYLIRNDIGFIRVPCKRLPEPQLVIGTETFVGLRRIKLGIEIMLEGEN